jgi:hypothetical protein
MWMNAVVSLLPLLLLLGLFLFMARMLQKGTRKGQAIREQEAKEIRSIVEELIVPELRGIRLSIDQNSAELREARLPSGPDLRK